jgi:hypothetical protein
MPNDTLAANAASMPTRRAALGSVAAASALFAVPAAAALTAHPDAELFALSRQARALIAEDAALEAKFKVALDGMKKVAMPETLICQEGDDAFLSKKHLEVGSPLFPASYAEARSMRDMLMKLCAHLTVNDRTVGEEGVRMFERSCEIARDAAAYEAAREAAREAAGLPALNDEITRVNAELYRTYRAIALRPARTLDGVLAKLAACGGQVAEYWPLDPDNDDEDFTAMRVAEAAAIDYAALLKAQEG